jgi:hypothetical protein
MESSLHLPDMRIGTEIVRVIDLGEKGGDLIEGVDTRGNGPCPTSVLFE